MKFEDLSRRVIGAAIEVHKVLGPGLMESAYEVCLSYEFDVRGIPFQRQVALPVNYKGITLHCGYRIDILVDDALIIELKCVESIEPIHEAQLLTYMKLAYKKTGLLMNFHVPFLREGLRRFVL